MSAKFKKGQMVRLKGTVTRFGEAVDPADFHLHVEDPEQNATDHTASVVNDTVGQYHYDLHLDKVGTWKYCFGGANDDAGVTTGTIIVIEGCTVEI